MSEPQLNIYEDQVPRFYVEKYAGGGGLGWSVATGVTTFAIRLALTPDGSAVGGLSVTATEESGDGAGYYVGQFDTGSLASALVTHVGRSAFWILSKSGDIDMAWKRVRIVGHRPVS